MKEKSTALRISIAFVVAAFWLRIFFMETVSEISSSRQECRVNRQEIIHCQLSVSQVRAARESATFKPEFKHLMGPRKDSEGVH